MQPARLVIAGLALLAALGSGLLLLSTANREPDLVRATVLPEPRPLGEFELRDERGEPLSTAALAGQWHLVFFGFANCPDICPITLQQLALARRRLKAEGEIEDLRILFVSVDPGRDTPAVLAAYAAQFGDGVRAVTADPATLEEFAAALGIFFRVAPADGDDYEVSHSAAVQIGRAHV